MKLTAAIAASYFGAEVKVNGYYNNDSTPKEIVGTMTHVGLMSIGTGGGQYSYSQCQLILTPLSKISDEDAVEVAKIIDRNSTFSGEVTYQFKLVDAYDYKTNTDYKAPCVQRLVNGNECGLEIIGEHLLNSIILIDYLRSKGYDCGHGSIPSLIAAGVAVEKKD